MWEFSYLSPSVFASFLTKWGSTNVPMLPLRFRNQEHLFDVNHFAGLRSRTCPMFYFMCFFSLSHYHSPLPFTGRTRGRHTGRGQAGEDSDFSRLTELATARPSPPTQRRSPGSPRPRPRSLGGLKLPDLCALSGEKGLPAQWEAHTTRWPLKTP